MIMYNGQDWRFLRILHSLKSLEFLAFYGTQMPIVVCTKPVLVPILGQMNSVNNLTSYFY
jgi:hypothetical protein